LAEKSSKHNMGKSSKNIKVIKTDHRKKKTWKCSPLGNPMKSLFLGWYVGVVRWITMGSSSSRWNHGARRMGLSHDLQMVLIVWLMIVNDS
jgi:hypothetical protein